MTRYYCNYMSVIHSALVTILMQCSNDFGMAQTLRGLKYVPSVGLAWSSDSQGLMAK